MLHHVAPSFEEIVEKSEDEESKEGSDQVSSQTSSKSEFTGKFY